MQAILRHLPAGARVLDLGCRDGSFPRTDYPDLRFTALDREAGAAEVQADAAALPFQDAAFHAVIAFHSLEHMEALDAVLSEMGRVLRPDGSIYVSVPDASTFSDRLYRWIYHGGGHVNLFRNPAELTGRITSATGLPLRATRVLHASFLYLERRHFRPRPPRRMWLFANGDGRVILALSFLLRTVDRLASTRLSVYGWAFWFGNLREPVDTLAWTNVCVHCGSGTPAELLPVRRRFLLRSYDCASCGASNLYTPDRPERT